MSFSTACSWKGLIHKEALLYGTSTGDEFAVSGFLSEGFVATGGHQQQCTHRGVRKERVHPLLWHVPCSSQHTNLSKIQVITTLLIWFPFSFYLLLRSTSIFPISFPASQFPFLSPRLFSVSPPDPGSQSRPWAEFLAVKFLNSQGARNKKLTTSYFTLYPPELGQWQKRVTENADRKH